MTSGRPGWYPPRRDVVRPRAGTEYTPGDHEVPWLSAVAQAIMNVAVDFERGGGGTLGCRSPSGRGGGGRTLGPARAEGSSHTHGCQPCGGAGRALAGSRRAPARAQAIRAGGTRGNRAGGPVGSPGDRGRRLAATQTAPRATLVALRLPRSGARPAGPNGHLPVRTTPHSRGCSPVRRPLQSRRIHRGSIRVDRVCVGGRCGFGHARGLCRCGMGAEETTAGAECADESVRSPVLLPAE